MSDSPDKPTGDLIIRVQAMPADSNAAGDIFGGWVMSQMDLAAGVRGAERVGGRVVTAAVQSLAFRKPVKIGDTLCVYARIEKVGRTSVTLHVEAWARRYLSQRRELVTEGSFVMVALDAAGQPTPVPPELD
ncbi:acyl-CoA thioesterase [Aureimonas phyllosphaerae]|uniref:Acyl-CoA thioesterase YciA n=1 Tax=Aureimonas phyllosphaerae TaxID=1166078 RepID=A0A7W6FU20_9HYPH|nr:acyl-CoA thioesterase [Aureimonas phyllosphaerae]MBB3935774.1 acyl-CoA thioesterase YciA [Aureimonas phyllosphaerae]MBB3959782.1 acyl-CoA thioesterase YciA [Aureimonas phyllosphaerae]SFF14959.1 acyl-CoA thioesterase YciA [Aureimonas phyllosphaerae]